MRRADQREDLRVFQAHRARAGHRTAEAVGLEHEVARREQAPRAGDAIEIASDGAVTGCPEYPEQFLGARHLSRAQEHIGQRAGQQQAEIVLGPT